MNGIGMKLEYGYLLIHSNFLNMFSIRISISNGEKAEEKKNYAVSRCVCRRLCVFQVVMCKIILRGTPTKHSHTAKPGLRAKY